MGSKTVSEQGRKDIKELTEMIKTSYSEEVRQNLLAWRKHIIDGLHPHMSRLQRGYLLKLHAMKVIPEDKPSGVVMCGELVKAPPGCVGNAPRFGRSR